MRIRNAFSPRCIVSLIFFLCLVLQVTLGQSTEKFVAKPLATHPERSRERDQWFYRGRVVRGLPTAELRRRAYQQKLRMRAGRAMKAHPESTFSTGSWIPLGPVPLASDASGNGTQDYHQVAGRATAVAIDPADPTGNTIYIGGAQGGVWKSMNAANVTPNNVIWVPVTDDQATLSIGAIAIQPGNSDPTKSVILAATGEADDTSDSYFGLGILRSADGGNTWSLISGANGNTLSFAGLGGTRMAFSRAVGQTNVAVAAMATSTEGVGSGAVTSQTKPGLYTSQDAGQTWNADTLSDPGGAADATSATSVVYNDGAIEFFAAVRYHGFYSSPDGVNWTRLANQPGGAALSTAACPAQSTSNGQACPIFRGEISTVPGRNEMYAWYISVAADGSTVDGGIWQSTIGGASWTSISDSAIANCGDVEGCGVEQGAYDLELLAVADGAATDLYAGGVNVYKCSITTLNPTCAASPFFNLTHAYGCDPAGAPAHVHPNQHALAYAIPSSGSDSGNALMYFANDGGIYRALDGFLGLSTGSCTGTNAFDDLNQNLGSMTQFVSFSQHPSNADILLGGTQGNGSPATNQATVDLAWGNVLGGDGGYNAIDPSSPLNFYASNPDVAPAGLGVQLCPAGTNCNNGLFNFVVTSEDVGGDDGGFYFPYILDPQSTSAMLVGTCRIWRGPRTGGTYTALSPNFETLGSGTCSGSEVNVVTAIAADGPTDKNGSSVIYAATSGLGPIDGPLNSPTGGHIWITTDATAGPSSFADMTNNGPAGNINPNQFPISGVAIDPSDATGGTAYVTLMGFTGGPGHVWKTANAGATWVDFTANLPDSPVNAALVYPAGAEVFVATDVGVFASSTLSPNWTELGPDPASGQPGFLSNVAVTALGMFTAGGQQLLRVSTYGRGIWQFNLVSVPDFALAISNSPLDLFPGQSGVFNGTLTAIDGYASTVTLSCVAGTTPPPPTCTPTPSTLTPGNATPFTVAVGGGDGEYDFNVQGTGDDPNHVTHIFPVTLEFLDFGLSTPSPAIVTVEAGATSSPANFQATAGGSFSQSVTVTCTTAIAGATCILTPGATVNPTSSLPVNMTAAVSVPAATPAGSYPVTISATTAGAPSPVTTSFTLNVTSNQDFSLTEPSAFSEINAGSAGGTGPISIAAVDGFAGTVSLTCQVTSGASGCSVSPASVNTFPAAATVSISGASSTAGAYSATVTGTSGSLVHTLAVPFNVGDYSISGTQTLSVTPGMQATVTLKLTSLFGYSGTINATCDASALPAAICVLSPANPVSVASGGTTNLTATIDIPNDAVAGIYNIKINTQDTTGTPGHSATVALTIGQDFEVIALPANQSQTVTAGQMSGAYGITVQPVGSSFNAAVTVSCSGLPPGAQCLFNQTNATSVSVTPGSSQVQIVMNVSTSSNSAASRRAKFIALWLMFPAIAIVGAGWRRKSRGRVAGWMAVGIALLLPLGSCSGISEGTVGGGGGGNPVSYNITISGSSPGIAADAGQSTVVTLVVE